MSDQITPPEMPDDPNDPGYVFNAEQRARVRHLTTGESWPKEHVRHSIGSVLHRGGDGVLRRAFADDWLTRYRSIRGDSA